MRFRLPRVLATVATAALVFVGLAGTAHADSYRFWGYYQWTDGEWAFATAGPADTVPDDGATEGWRFAVGTESSTRFPRTGDVFDDICGGATAEAGQKRVAVVVDYGTADDAPEGDQPPQPRGECAVVAGDASGADVLTAVGEVRLGDGLTCAIDGYPASGCGGPVDGQAPTGAEEEVSLALPEDGGDAGETEADAGDAGEAEADTGSDDEDSSAASDTEEDGDGMQTGVLIIGIVLVLVVGIGAFLRARRSKGQ